MAPFTGSPFHPQVLREYALVADGERGALVGPNGEIVWMCWPRWHSEPVFGSLLGDAGGYAVTPDDRFVWGGYYEEGSLIWHSHWVTTGGVVECREALAFPGDANRALLLREITALDRPARVRVLLDPRAGFGGPAMRGVRRTGDGAWTARLGRAYLRWSGDVREAAAEPSEGGSRLVMTLSLGPGEHRHLLLELSDQPFRDGPDPPGQLWQSTRANWRQAVPTLPDLLAVRDSRHAYAVMRGMTSADGGMVAAITTSLPERAEAGRNYDYRYAWIRDQSYAGQAVAVAAGADPLLDGAARFISSRLLADGPRLAPAYTVTGGAVPNPRRLDLAGYPGGFDLVGNRVNEQFQLDGFGEALLLLAAAARQGLLDGDGWRAMEVAADTIRDRWGERDAGVWEIHAEHWTHSRLTCVAGLRAAAAARGQPGDGWLRLADGILADTARRATHHSGRWQRSPTDAGLDGALLLPPLRGALPAADPRTVATLQAYQAEMTQEGYAYRFRHGDRPLGEVEGAFLLCGFLAALAWHQQGDVVQAARWFERHRAACGPPGLFTEEFDVAQRQLRGNLPQAFVHALLLESAARLAGPPGSAAR